MRLSVAISLAACALALSIALWNEWRPDPAPAPAAAIDAIPPRPRAPGSAPDAGAGQARPPLPEAPGRRVEPGGDEVAKSRSGDRPPAVHAFSGRVLDRRKAPIPGARVAALAPADPLGLRFEEVAVATSDGEGRFSVDVPPGTGFLRAHRAGYAVGVAPAEPHGGSIELILEPGVVLSGRVREHGGDRGIPGAAVDLAPDPGTAGAAWRAALSEATTTTDEFGRFEFRDLPRTQVRLTARVDGYAERSVVRSLLAVTGERRTAEIEIALPRADRRVAGRVLDPEDRPVPFAVVVAADAGGETRGQATADEHGAFSIERLADGEYALRARAEGFGPGEATTVAAGAEDAIVRVVPACRITGRILAAGGADPGPARVEVHAVEGRFGRKRLRRVVATDERGRFDSGALAPGRYSLLVVAQRAAPRWLEGISVMPGTDADVSVELGAGGSVRGVAVDARGEPVAKARVALCDADYDPTSRRASPMVLDGLFGRSVETGADGGFRIDHIPEGVHGLFLVAPGGAYEVVRDVSIRDGEVTSCGRIRLSIECVVKGVARNVDGRPLREVVLLLRSGGVEKRATTDEEGRFRFVGVPAGACEIRVAEAGFFDSRRYEGVAHAVADPSAETEVVVRLAPRGERP